MSFISVHENSPFSLSNVPLGVFIHSSGQKHIATRIGNTLVDLHLLAQEHVFSEELSLAIDEAVLLQPDLNSLAAHGNDSTSQLRSALVELLTDEGRWKKVLQGNEGRQSRVFSDASTAEMCLPMTIGDYTDFYAGINHATNVGVLFRGKDNALQPNYRHLPVGYHGRASSVVVSGTPIRRPCGQILLDRNQGPEFAACRKLDYELELAAFLCKGNPMGQRIGVDEAKNYIFGYVLMNDWSARDIQAWEYVPLGPFNSKNFGTTISPWILLPDAVKPFYKASKHDQSHLLPYLKQTSPQDLAFDLTVSIQVDREEDIIGRAGSEDLLYNFSQMLAHHTSTGCPMRCGDLLGSGTISGSGQRAMGSLLEASANGTQTVPNKLGLQNFLRDGDTVVMRGTAKGHHGLVGFGDCSGLILPAL